MEEAELESEIDSRLTAYLKKSSDNTKATTSRVNFSVECLLK